MEEIKELLPGDDLRAVVEIDVACIRDEHEFLRLGGETVRILAEFTGMGVRAGDEEQRPGRDGVDVVEG